jgi:imidazolonepropionase-like amidohydrolase
MMRNTFLTSLFILCSTVPAFADQVLRAKIVHPVNAEAIENGEVIIGDDGLIRHVGPAGSGDSAGAAVVDLGELELYPGLIAASSSLGLTEIASVRPSNDFHEIGDHNARLLAYRAINPDSELIPVARQNGITHMQVVPGGGLIRGRSGVMRTSGWTWAERLELGPSGLHMNWPSMGLDRGDDAPPLKEQTKERAERIGELDAVIAEARSYAAARRDDNVDRDLELEAWTPVVAGKMPLFIHADEERQIRAAVEWGQKHQLRVVISGGREAWRLGELLAAAEVPVILERVMGLPSRDSDGAWSGYQRAARLYEQGVKLVISLPGGAFGDTVARNLPFHAGMARAHGLPYDVALASITLNAAEVIGVGDRLGSLEVGKQATMIAVRGDVLEITDPVERMWIAGEEVSLENRHTRLFERYRNRPTPGGE